MHNNYYFLRILSSEIQKLLIGFNVGEIFSQTKNELIISFYKDNSKKYLKAHLSPQFCCLSFPDNYNRARRNSVDLFQDIIDLEVSDIVQTENDRSFFLDLKNDYKLLFKMHGNRSNVVLFKGSNIIEIFKSSLKQDANIQLNSLKKNLELSESNLKNFNGDYRKMIPTLGKSFAEYFKSRDYDQLQHTDRYKSICELMDYLQQPKIYIHSDINGLPQLTLLKTKKEDIEFSSAIEALNVFFMQYIRLHSLNKEKSTIRNEINEQIRKSETYIKKSTDRLNQISHSTSYQHFGDLIMANLHQIAPFSKECKLTDFYTQEEIKVPLKGNLSAQLNAENYYRKSKKQKIEIEQLSKNIGRKKLHKQQLILDLSAIEEATDLKQFNRKKTKEDRTKEQDYHSIDIMGFMVLVGKNAVKNDRLTFKVAKKDDLFLHAKDSSGSHVIIRKKGIQNFPKPVIEQAASLAAFYSKSKTESFCSVLYTPRKYVRKAKGSPAGSVIVEREQVILAEPKSIDDILKN